VKLNDEMARKLTNMEYSNFYESIRNKVWSGKKVNAKYRIIVDMIEARDKGDQYLLQKSIDSIGYYNKNLKEKIQKMKDDKKDIDEIIDVLVGYNDKNLKIKINKKGLGL
jgi:ribosomal protein S16